MKSVLFIHRSVGHNLIQDGRLYQLIKNDDLDIALSDYDQNLDILTDNEGKQKKCNLAFPGNDTKPEAYAEIFDEKVQDRYCPIQEMALSYDIVMIKSCYPNSNIKSDNELKAIKSRYKQIASFFTRRPNKQLIILTSPPLTPLMTLPSRAKRSRSLASWLAGTEPGSNVYVFNLFDYLADTKHSWLKRAYRRKLIIDSHPNKKASASISPKLVNFLASCLAD